MNQVIIADETILMTLPVYQPRRYWTQKHDNEAASVRSEPGHNRVSTITAATCFKIKGGFVQTVGGTRRMVIAGKIFKNEMVHA